jgi:hypothetical protein
MIVRIGKLQFTKQISKGVAVTNIPYCDKRLAVVGVIIVTITVVVVYQRRHVIWGMKQLVNVILIGHRSVHRVVALED